MNYESNLRTRLDEFVAQGHLTAAEAEGAHDLFVQYHTSPPEPVDWASIQPMADDEYFAYSAIKPLTGTALKEALSKVAILKLNGGLGTSMGCTGPKTLITVKNDMSFLEIIVRQVAAINKKHGVDVPLIFMNSFNTDEQTKEALSHIDVASKLQIINFNQAHFPRLDAETLLPLTDASPNEPSYWYPPGHGDVLRALIKEKLVDTLLAKGIEWVFISSGDNLGATIDDAIVSYLSTLKDIDFLSEQTPKTLRDVKGGVLTKYKGKIRLLETAQVPKDHLDEFCDIKKFKSFNVNSVYVRLSALKRLDDSKTPIALDIIVNPKTVDGHRVIQLEQAVGAGITFFKSQGLLVSRKRFIPVKKTSDLITVQSDVYSIDEMFILTAECEPPTIEFGPTLEKMDGYTLAFDNGKTIPSLRGARTVKILGGCKMGPNVSIRGDYSTTDDIAPVNCTLGNPN
ncbi:UTP-glucose-1-phosphate uridylyltransferase [Giardia muris]|uniref:UTP--glucose-1-phosphate uridylyltransferase n=1 Tax=Giardia muris TaxID=5742 RepID=A0A4Z1SWN4_GIAMU|nr:UTP-glucose-1-phosphate uridylyltransferase [Giardia muris]|eukprot:TNJ30146.1 UTP-glucose-1-phosphate uridylyltransferase [Giardia muris]